jgi:hypothetical protein
MNEERLTRGSAEEPVHEEREPLVEPIDQRHHDADEYEHNARVAEQLSPGWSYHLAKFDEHLADEQREPRERAAPLGALPSRVRDDVLAGFVDHFACHTHYLSDLNLQGGQDLNLQPAVLETAALPIEPPPYERNPSCIRHAQKDFGHAKAWQISTTGISVRHGFGRQKR